MVSLEGSAGRGPPSGSVRWSPPRHGFWPAVHPSFPRRTAPCRAGSFPRKSSIRAPVGRRGAGVLHTSSWKGHPIPCTVLFFFRSNSPACLSQGRNDARLTGWSYWGPPQNCFPSSLIQLVLPSREPQGSSDTSASRETDSTPPVLLAWRPHHPCLRVPDLLPGKDCLMRG